MRTLKHAEFAISLTFVQFLPADFWRCPPTLILLCYQGPYRAAACFCIFFSVFSGVTMRFSGGNTLLLWNKLVIHGKTLLGDAETPCSMNGRMTSVVIWAE
jgi:hypothetical protein